MVKRGDNAIAETNDYEKDKIRGERNKYFMSKKKYYNLSITFARTALIPADGPQFVGFTRWVAVVILSRIQRSLRTSLI